MYTIMIVYTQSCTHIRTCTILHMHTYYVHSYTCKYYVYTCTLSGFHLLGGAGGKLPPPPNPPTSPQKVLTIIQCLCVYNNSSNDKILALQFLCISQKLAYGTSNFFCILCTQSIFAYRIRSSPPNKNFR